VGRRVSRDGGIERAGETSVGRLAATWRVGSGDGIGARRFGAMCVARAGDVARTRLTTVAFRDLGLLVTFFRDFEETFCVLFRAGCGFFFVFFKFPRLFPILDCSRGPPANNSKIQ